MELKRLRIVVKGQVQGVGFRPHVYRTASQLGLTGWVKNTAAGVCIEIQGCLASRFLSTLNDNLPQLAKITDLQTTNMTLSASESTFEILASEQGDTQTLITPDTCICSDCLSELFDPQSHYYQYPFLNCTNCGPRLTITRQLPYDRAHTSMDCFPLCDACRRDYCDPMNRRYHAQPTACAQCGPRLSSSIEDIAQRIFQGEIIAIKGLGGYQLICDARNDAAVSLLRTRKQRDSKPFALMVLNTASAKQIVDLTSTAEVILNSPERPVVILRKCTDVPRNVGNLGLPYNIESTSSLPAALSPGLSSFGIMLPATPLHYLLFHALVGSPDGLAWLGERQSTVLVVTSANPGGSPLVIDDETATRELSGIADHIVSYDRQIVTRADDSVLRLIHGAPMFIRRARGYVPTPIQLAHEIPPTLAVGGHSKNTFCITRGDEAFVSQHIGTLDNKATIEFFHETLNHLLMFLNVKPECIAHDLHPDFYTTHFAKEYGVPAFSIQHHYAHLAAVAAEHHLQNPVLGLALDGYGYGEGGGAWGGELFVFDNLGFQRLGSFKPLPQPGGEIAAREPWRMGAAVLHGLGRASEISHRFAEAPQAHVIHQLLDNHLRCPLTSSCGRLFDAASALLGIQLFSQYEGQAAMCLESLATDLQFMPNGWCIDQQYLDFSPTMAMLANIQDPVTGANLFHGTLIAGLTEWIQRNVRETGIDEVVLSGGCFLNQVLTEGLVKALGERGVKPILPRMLPPNDGGLSLGQAWIAGNSLWSKR